MNYEEARRYLDQVNKYGSVLGLDNMRELLERLGNPQDQLKFVHIAGTNGKGSVLACVSTILTEAGYCVGRYISPTLFAYRERIQINGQYIEKEAVARLTGQIARAIDEMVSEGKAHPTIFEVETAMSFLYFAEKKCDIVVLETGLGGSLDATNVVRTSILEVITSVSMDHFGILGDTLGEIAAQKAGIIKPDTAVVCGVQKPEAMEVIRSACEERNCELFPVEESLITEIHYGYEHQTFSYRAYHNLEIRLAGVYQIQNAAVAVEAILCLNRLGYPVTEDQMRTGLLKTVWRGRFTVLSENPVFVIDGAHNADAARVLRESVKLYFTNRKIFYIMGIFRDKEYEEIIKTTVPLAAHVIAIQTPENARALPREELADVIRKYHHSVETADTVADAVAKSYELAAKEDVIIAFGSLSFLGEVTEAVEMRSVGK